MKNLYQAYENAKRGKGWYDEVKLISERPYYYLAALKWMLENHKFKTSEYQVFMRHEGRKDRQIYKLPFFPDRIAQWAIIQVIEPHLLASLTTDTYSALPGRGIHAAFRKLRHAMDTAPNKLTYCLKMDCQKFYPSIDHGLLKASYRRKFKDPELLAVIDEIIDSVSTCPATEENIRFYASCGNPIRIIHTSSGDYLNGVGIPIGNYFSQYDGNFFLSGFDHWVKEELKIKHYFRYMDDICIFSESKTELHQILRLVEFYFEKKLHLRIKGNHQIFPSYIRGVDFVGYRLFKDCILLRKSIAAQMKRKLRIIRKKVEAGGEMSYSDYCRIGSYQGWLKHCNGYRLSEKYVQPLQQYAEEYHQKHISKKGGTHD